MKLKFGILGQSCASASKKYWETSSPDRENQNAAQELIMLLVVVLCSLLSSLASSEFISSKSSTTIDPVMLGGSKASEAVNVDGDFDFLELKMDWLPGWCRAEGKMESAGCKAPEDVWEQKLHLAGLLPRYSKRRSKQTLPTECKREKDGNFNFSPIMAVFDGLSVSTPNLESDPSKPLSDHMKPWQSWWELNGVCSGMSQSDHFQLALNLYSAHQGPFSSLVAGGLKSKRVDTSELDKLCVSHSCVLQCASMDEEGKEKKKKKGSEQFFVGVSVCLEKDKPHALKKCSWMKKTCTEETVTILSFPSPPAADK